MYDVAKRAGTSIATVSRVLRRPDEVREQTRELVHAAIRELGYVPSGSARGLAARQTGVLGLCFPDVDGIDDPANLVAYGLPAPDLAVAGTLLDCHHRAQQILSGVGGIRSGWSIATQAFQAEPGCEDVKQAYGYPRDDWYLEMSRGDEWVGVQAYTRTIIGPDGPRAVPEGVETTLTGWEYYPPAMAEGVRSAWELTGGVPVFVTENGIATCDDPRRIDYTEAALADLHRAIVAGITAEGYRHWSLLDTYEWASGCRPTFGLIGWNKQTFVRRPKPSLAWLGAQAGADALTVRRPDHLGGTRTRVCLPGRHLSGGSSCGCVTDR